MTFHCSGCERDLNYSEFKFLLVPARGSITRLCKDCRCGTPTVHDVYWDGRPEINLADGPDGKPRTFISKGQKAAYLKERGIMECGDSVHGAPVQIHQNQHKAPDSRPQIREALQKVKNMSKSYRRQEYLRIINGGR